MSPEKQRIAIAEACGHGPGTDCWHDQVSEEEFVHRDDCPCNGTGWNIPDYLNDINAMHEAEKTLETVGKMCSYVCKLGRIVRVPKLEGGFDTDVFRLTHATAAQRAQAFLMTLGKWEEEPIQHGVNCEKAAHTRTGYLHDEDDDTPYDVDGCRYCGRCHQAI